MEPTSTDRSQGVLDPASPMVAKPMLDGVADLISLCLLLGDVYVAKTSIVS
jgi:hypothetical protein